MTTTTDTTLQERADAAGVDTLAERLDRVRQALTLIRVAVQQRPEDVDASDLVDLLPALKRTASAALDETFWILRAIEESDTLGATPTPNEDEREDAARQVRDE